MVCGHVAALIVIACALAARAATQPLAPEYQATPIPDGIRLQALPSHSSQIVGVVPADWDLKAIHRDNVSAAHAGPPWSLLVALRRIKFRRAFGPPSRQRGRFAAQQSLRFFAEDLADDAEIRRQIGVEAMIHCGDDLSDLGEQPRQV